MGHGHRVVTGVTGPGVFVSEGSTERVKPEPETATLSLSFKLNQSLFIGPAQRPSAA